MTFMLATGVQIGEALAVSWDQVNLAEARVAITKTVVRLKGEGLVVKPTNSRADERDLDLPNRAVAMLRRRSCWSAARRVGVLSPRTRPP
ncbi:hypothetical protein ACQPXM_11920 [Kribbella sp. CA-253562]|uniref:hypothetical protein n=1 Tax=Kribbella sp. CA-253562 TaxID=3239942 RepID=UPI003D91CBA1